VASGGAASRAAGYGRDIMSFVEKLKSKFSSSVAGTIARQFPPPAVPAPPTIAHSKWVDHLTRTFNQPGTNVLEIGARVVTGANFRPNFSKANYTGFDFYPGENVDVVGDAHKLASYFPGKTFDLIFSTACFEHFYMPWIVAEEIGKLLKLGGFVFVETHFSFAYHETPWNFFQFSDMGLRVLFNPGLGFRIVESGMSNPMVGFFGREADAYLRYKPVEELYCHSEILCEKVREVADFSWRDVSLQDLVQDTRYPNPQPG
jgi:hypothetical protein